MAFLYKVTQAIIVCAASDKNLSSSSRSMKLLSHLTQNISAPKQANTISFPFFHSIIPVKTITDGSQLGLLRCMREKGGRMSNIKREIYMKVHNNCMDKAPITYMFKAIFNKPINYYRS